MPSHHRSDRAPRTRATVLAFAASLALPVVAMAQQATSSPRALVPGTAVRIHVGGPPGDTLLDGSPLSLKTTRWSGRLVRVDAEAIVLARGTDTTSIPRVLVRAFEARTGDRSRRRLVVRRAALGAGLGAATGAVLAGVFYEPCDGEWYCYPRSQEMAITGALWSVPGAALGAITGMFGDTRRWEAVTLAPATRVGVSVVPGGARLSLAF